MSFQMHVISDAAVHYVLMSDKLLQGKHEISRWQCSHGVQQCMGMSMGMETCVKRPAELRMIIATGCWLKSAISHTCSLQSRGKSLESCIQTEHGMQKNG